MVLLSNFSFSGKRKENFFRLVIQAMAENAIYFFKVFFYYFVVCSFFDVVWYGVGGREGGIVTHTG